MVPCFGSVTRTMEHGRPQRSLSLGFLAAFAVNLALVRFGVEEGMENPATVGQQSAAG